MTDATSQTSAKEKRRLKVLAQYQLLDTPPSEDFDRLVSLAARLFQVPIVLVSLIGKDKQFFKSRVGTDLCETRRDISFCTYAIEHDDILFVPDARLDPRFATNPMVLGPPFIRFYAGQPLIAPTGERLGTVCLIDTEPHASLSEDDRANLADLTTLVMERMETHRLDRAREISQVRFENIAATSPDAIICSDNQGIITFWNRAAEKIFGYQAQDILHKPASTIVPDSWLKVYHDELKRLQQGQAMKLADQTIELSGLRKDGTEFPAEFSLSTWTDSQSTHVGAIVRDITERRHNEERLFRLASLDALTNLANRSAWQARLAEILADELPATILLIDLDGFKEINDSFGHSAGDAVLKDIAQQMRATLKEAVMLARLGGDEFVALLPGNEEQAARHIAQELMYAIAEPIDFAGQAITVHASMGISLAPLHGTRAEDILNAADLALYKAKSSGKGRCEIFTAALREVAVARRSFERELRLAFENGEFELFYQPQVCTQTRCLSGAEALIRWNHPSRGLLTPLSFIDVLSEKQSAPAIGAWILRTACASAVEWQKKHPSFRISVNLFDAQLRSNRLLTTVLNTLAETGLPAHCLELEIVENIVVRNESVTKNLLHSLRDMGVGLSFDDYGTGYASLSLLKTYPVSRLKIDRSFIRHVDTDPENAAVVKAIIYLANNFGLEIIAEGVETESELAFLQSNGCTQIQGYIFGRPVPVDEFTARFINHTGPLQTGQPGSGIQAA